MRIRKCLAGLVLWAGIPAAANAALWTFDGALNIGQSVDSVPGTTVPVPYFGGGLVHASFDDVSGIFSWDFTYQGLSGDALVAHFHEAPSLATGPVKITVIPAPGAPPSGTFSGSVDTATIVGGVAGAAAALTGAGAFSPGDETGWYLNIHTALNGPGELRGQLFVTSVVPLPAALWLAVPAVGFVLRKRRRR